MLSICEDIQERGLGRDDGDRLRIDVTKLELYLKQLILWIRILISVVLVLSLVTIVVWNFDAPTSKDVSDRGIEKVLKAVNTENIAGLVAEGDSGRFSTTSTILPNGST